MNELYRACEPCNQTGRMNDEECRNCDGLGIQLTELGEAVLAILEAERARKQRRSFRGPGYRG